jgi:hypothetical protein
MPRNISFALTAPQFLAGTKDVTRRMGWAFVKPGDELIAVRKGMGLKRGEKVSPLGRLRVVAVRVEPLGRMLLNTEYGNTEAAREGFPEMTGVKFVDFFCASHKGCSSLSDVTRIEFVKL